jgi:hypothetical protein
VLALQESGGGEDTTNFNVVDLALDRVAAKRTFRPSEENCIIHFRAVSKPSIGVGRCRKDADIETDQSREPAEVVIVR